MKKTKLILYLSLALALIGCKVTDIDNINNYYRTKYPQTVNYKFTKSKEKARKTTMSSVFRELLIRDTIISIEYFGYANGNFDELFDETFIYEKDKLIKAYSLTSANSKKVEDITNELSSDTKKTNELILKLLDKGEFKKLSQLHTKAEYSVSDAGIIYVTFLDKNLDVLQGYMFNEFMVSEPIKW